MYLIIHVPLVCTYNVTLILYQSIINHYPKEIYMYSTGTCISLPIKFSKDSEIHATRPYELSPRLITCEWKCVWDSPFFTKKIITKNALVMTFWLGLIKILLYNDLWDYVDFGFRVIVLNATFNNISVISWGQVFIGEGNQSTQRKPQAHCIS